MIIVLVTTVTLAATALMVTVAPARNPVPLIVTGVGRTVEPVDGEIAVTLSAPGALGTLGAIDGPDGDPPSQAAHPIANANSNTPRWVILVMDCSLLYRKRKSAVRT